MSYPEHNRHAHYVTARSGDHTVYLAGPYPSHRDALAREDDCRRIIRKRFAHDMAATFAEIGTARVTYRHGHGRILGKFTALLDKGAK